MDLSEDDMSEDDRNRCPKCNQEFDTSRACNVHIYHKQSTCKDWMSEASAPPQLLPPSLHKAPDNRVETFHVIDDDMDYEMESPGAGPSNVTGRDEVHCLPFICYTFLLNLAFNFQQREADADDERESGPVRDIYPGASRIEGKGLHNYEKIYHHDTNAKERKGNEKDGPNPFVPFADFSDWEVARWLASLNVSMEKVDEFFKLNYVRSNSHMWAYSTFMIIILGSATETILYLCQGTKE